MGSQCTPGWSGGDWDTPVAWDVVEVWVVELAGAELLVCVAVAVCVTVVVGVCADGEASASAAVDALTSAATTIAAVAPITRPARTSDCPPTCRAARTTPYMRWRPLASAALGDEREPARSIRTTTTYDVKCVLANHVDHSVLEAIAADHSRKRHSNG